MAIQRNKYISRDHFWKTQKLNLLDKDFKTSVLNMLKELKENMGKELEIEGNYLSIIKAIHVKSTSNIIHNGKRLLFFPLRLATRQGCWFSTLLSTIVLEVLARKIRTGKEQKASKLERRKQNYMYSRHNLYEENPKDSVHRYKKMFKTKKRIQQVFRLQKQCSTNNLKNNVLTTNCLKKFDNFIHK